MFYEVPPSPGRDEESELSRSRIYEFGADVVFGFGLMTFCGGVALALFVGCSPAATTPAGSAYEAQQAVCLGLHTHNERVTCINQVRAEWAADAGGK